jgi:hypothetical protein
MRRLLWLPAIPLLLLFFKNTQKVADLIDVGDWGHAIIYMGAALIGTICGIIALTGNSTSKPLAKDGPTEK